MKEIAGPLGGLTGAQLATVALDEQACQAPVHVVIDLPKFDGGVAKAEGAVKCCSLLVSH